MRWAANIVFLLVAASGCFSRESIPNQRALDPSSTYVEALERSTEQVEAFEDLDIHVHVFATRLDDRFQRAYRDEYRTVFGMYPSEGRDLDNENVAFVLAITANNNDLTRLSAFTSLWNVTYDGGVTQPVQATTIESFDSDPLYLRYFFPYWNPWRQVYRFEFPAPATAAQGTLSLKGPAGDIRLDW